MVTTRAPSRGLIAALCVVGSLAACAPVSIGQRICGACISGGSPTAPPQDRFSAMPIRSQFRGPRKRQVVERGRLA